MTEQKINIELVPHENTPTGMERRQTALLVSAIE